MSQPDHPEAGDLITEALMDKWDAYDARLRAGEDVEGSLLAACFIIARSGVTDVRDLVRQLLATRAKLAEVERAANVERMRANSWQDTADKLWKERDAAESRLSAASLVIDALRVVKALHETKHRSNQDTGAAWKAVYDALANFDATAPNQATTGGEGDG